MTRRFFQFGLATMLLFVAAICVVLAVRANRQHNRRVAIAKIESLGGEIEYLGPKGSRVIEPDLGLLARLLGDDDASTYVYVVSFPRGGDVNDGTLSLLLPLRELHFLLIRNCPVTDKGIAMFQEAMPNCVVQR